MNTPYHLLLSLPPAAVAHLAELDARLPEGTFSLNDPPGSKLGSGGGLVHVLASAWRDEDRGVSLEEWLSDRPRMVIHSGGQSRRCPAYAPEGKVLTPMPVLRWSYGQRLDQTLLDLQCPFIEDVVQSAPDGVVAGVYSGDVLLQGQVPARLPDADVICVGLWTSPEAATHHGVFFCDRKTPDRLRFMRQKPSVEEIRGLVRESVFLIDSGFWLFSERAIRVLFDACGWENGRFAGGMPSFYDLYTTFGLALGESPSEPCADVGDLSVAVVPVKDGAFYHLGTSRELVTATLSLQNAELDQQRFGSLMPKHPAAFIQNAEVGVGLTPENHTIWIENASVPAGWRLTHSHVLTGIPDNDWQLDLPAGVCLDLVPVGEDRWCVRAYGIGDAFRGAVRDDETHWFGKPVTQWFEDRGLTLEACGIDPETDCQEAALFPVVTEDELCGEFVQWLLGQLGAQGEESPRSTGKERRAKAAGRISDEPSEPGDLEGETLSRVAPKPGEGGSRRASRPVASDRRVREGETEWVNRPVGPHTPEDASAGGPDGRAEGRGAEDQSDRTAENSESVETPNSELGTPNSELRKQRAGGPDRRSESASHIGGGAEDRGAEDRGAEDRGAEDRGAEDRGPEDRGPEGRGPEDRGPEDRGPEDRGPEDRGAEDRGAEDRGAERQRGSGQATGNSELRKQWAAFYRDCPRLSAADLGCDAQLARRGVQRCARRTRAWQRLAAHPARSVFLRTDLGDAARAFDEHGLEPPPVSDQDGLTAVRLHMMRAAVRRRRGDASWETDEAAAFDALREMLLRACASDPVSPVRHLLSDQIIWGRSPVRLDLAGGWTDTPPYCLVHGGKVVTVAAELNGQPPIQVFGRCTDEPSIMLRSIDLGRHERVTTYEELGDFAHVGGPFSIPKAALALAGFLPVFNTFAPATLRDLLKQFGGGIELTLLAAVPKGSGLGTSSILAATVLGTVGDLCGLDWRTDDLILRTLVLEQLLTTGGGWQDQAGGITPGVTLLESQPGERQDIHVRWLPETALRQGLNTTVMLYYTGITRVAKGILQEVVRGMFLNSGPQLRTLEHIGDNAERMADALMRQDYMAVCACVRRSWELNCQLDRGTNPAQIEDLLARIEPWLAGCKLLGAGGGGYMLMLANDEEDAARIRRELTESPPNPEARFVDLSISETGLQITRS